MSDQLRDKRIAVLVANEGVEQIELTESLLALREAGAKVDLLAPEAGEVQALNHLDEGDTFRADKAVVDADAADYDGLVLPGGVATPISSALKRKRSHSSAPSSPPASPSARSAMHLGP